MGEVPALFARLLGDEAFAGLPPPLQSLHRRPGRRQYRGQVQVTRGDSWLSWLLATSTRLPPAGTRPILVEIDADSDREIWSRRVDGHIMRSRLWLHRGLLYERLGLVRFGFRLQVQQQAIIWQVVQVRALGLVPLPVRWFSQVQAREYAAQGCYCFDVRAALPLAGLLVHYQGWLDVDD